MTVRILLGLAAALVLAACNDHSMTQQSRYGTYTPAALFPDKNSRSGAQDRLG